MTSTQRVPEYTIFESQVPNVNFGVVQATDADSPGRNNQIFYYVTGVNFKTFDYCLIHIIITIGGPSMGIIDIVPTSGLVFLTRSIVREIINSCERCKMPLFKLISKSVVSES